MIDSRRVRAELERLLADQTHAVRDQAQRLADETWERVRRGQDASQAVASAMDALGIEGAMRDQLGRSVVQGLLSGAGILPEIALTAGAIDLFASRALVLSWDSTGMSLSTRLHGSLGTVQADVRHVVASAISRRDNAWKTARRIYDGYGFGGALNRASLVDLPRDLRQLVDASRLALLPPDSEALRREVAKLTRYAESLKTNALRASYRQLVDKLQGDLGRGLEKAVRAAVEEKTRYFAERILRTETARAWGQGFFAQVNDDPDAVGIEWNTSSAHLVFDICDFHARADLFGMGPGVYPKSRLPRYPAHPHCLCSMTAVYTAPAPRDQVEAGGKAALDSMTDSQQARLLTWTGKQGFDGSGSWQGSLRQWQAPGGAPMSPGAKAILQAAQAVPVGPPGIANGVVTDLGVALEAQERAIWRNDFETGVILKEGRPLISRKGGASSVSFDPSDRVAMYQAVVTHNHPSGWRYPADDESRAGNSFSSADLKLASVGMVQQMRAVTPKWTYAVEPNGKFPSRDVISAEFSAARDFVDWSFIGPVRRSDYFHTVNGIVAERLGWNYSREEHGFDRP